MLTQGEGVLPDRGCMRRPAKTTAVLPSFCRMRTAGNRYTAQTTLCSCSKAWQILLGA